MIGVFDSGLGGLTVLRRLREALPHHDILFLADQANVPYGDREPQELLGFMRNNVRWLVEHDADIIVPACNTSCAMALRFGWPEISVPIVDLIESAAIAIQRSGFKRIGVVATSATAASHAYRDRITRLVDAQVIEVAAPALAPLVEAGKLHGDQPAHAVADACAPLSDVDAVVLGCTHYPLLRAHFEAYFGPYVPVVDPALVQAERVAETVRELGIQHESVIGREPGRLECATNGDPSRFSANLEALAGDLHPTVRQVSFVMSPSSW